MATLRIASCPFPVPDDVARNGRLAPGERMHFGVPSDHPRQVDCRAEP